MTTAISIGWRDLIGKCRSIFLRYFHRSLTGQFGIMASPQNGLPQFEPVLDRLFPTKTLGSDFPENCGLVVPNFLWISSPGLHNLPRESSLVNFSHHTCLARWGKYQERVYPECVLNFSSWSSLRQLREPLHRDPSVFCRVILSVLKRE